MARDLLHTQLMQEKISKGGWGVSEVSCRPAAPTGGDSKNQTPAAFRFGFVKDSQMITVVSNSTGGGGGGLGMSESRMTTPPSPPQVQPPPWLGPPRRSTSSLSRCGWRTVWRSWGGKPGGVRAEKPELRPLRPPSTTGSDSSCTNISPVFNISTLNNGRRPCRGFLSPANQRLPGNRLFICPLQRHSSSSC